MKRVKKIEAEIKFHQDEYDRIKKLIDDSAMPELKRKDYVEIMSRHAARRQALLWVLGL